MSDTPRTDSAYEILLKPAGGNEKIVSIDFARTLERELATSEARLKEMTEIVRISKEMVDDYADHARSCASIRTLRECDCGYEDLLTRLKKAESTTDVKRDVYTPLKYRATMIMKNGKPFAVAHCPEETKTICDELNRLAGGGR